MREPGQVVDVVSPWVWCSAIVGLSYWGAAVARLPCLGVVRGPLGTALVAATAAVSLARVGWPWTPEARQARLLLLAATFVVSAVAGVRYASRLTASGDEPHYLLMAQSLWREGDLDLRDNVEREDYREYFPTTLTPHWGAPRADGRPFPAHSPGLPLLLAPFYALGGRAACVLLFAALATALAAQVYALALRLTTDDGAALFAGALAAGPPVFAYSFHLYTELPSALAVAVALRILTGSPGPTLATGAALAASALPWLHVKMIPAAVALGLLAVARLRGPSLAAFVAVAGVSTAAFLAYYHAIFGIATPLALYGGGLPPDSAVSPVRAAAGLLLDRSFGLLPYAPAFVLVPAALAASRGRARDLWPYLVLAIAILLPLLRWRMWWGGQCPPARFLVPLVPVLAPLAALRVAASRQGLRRWRWWLLGSGAALALFMAARPEALLMLNRGDRPTRVWDALSGATPVNRYLPSIVAAQTPDLRLAALWLGIVVLVLVLDVAARRHRGVDRVFQGAGLPLSLGLVVGILTDVWVRR